MTHTARWLEAESYQGNWVERSSMILDLFQESEFQENKHYVISEFGCGANAPFETICQNLKYFDVKKFDIKKWDSNTQVFNLNDEDLCFQPSDIFAFSGVLEYLNDVPRVLNEAINSSQYLLLSYAFLPKESNADDEAYLQEILHRSVKSGWRNHYKIDEFVNLLSKIGTISNVGKWGNQSLFVIRNFNLEFEIGEKTV